MNVIKLATNIKGYGFPILSLHGHPGNGDCMDVFTEKLSQRFKTISPDLRGYGKSSTNKNFTIREHLGDILNLLDELEIDRCLLLGWSLGGILSLELLLEHPQRFTGAILVASAAAPRSTHPPVTTQELIYTGLAGMINYLLPGKQWNIDLLARRSLLRHLIYQSHPTPYQYLARYGVPAYFRTSSFAQQSLTQALQKSYNRVQELQSINVPCLVLAGAEDKHISAASSHETALNLKNCSWILYKKTAHLFPWEIPTQVQLDIDSWLEGHPEVVSNST